MEAQRGYTVREKTNNLCPAHSKYLRNGIFMMNVAKWSSNIVNETIDEKPGAIEIIRTMFGDNFGKSNDTVVHRIDDITEDVQQQHFWKLRDELFSIQLARLDLFRCKRRTGKWGFNCLNRRIIRGRKLLSVHISEYPTNVNGSVVANRSLGISLMAVMGII
ncbi:hypothetical protein TNCV_255651 [Trichonephila clavipes]|nr:hypothetical protein TNCV_255651 [Trichonephila clavipes]